MDQKQTGLKMTIFFCHRIDANQEMNRRPLEKEFGPKIRFFPLPCSGRIESLHLMRALETGADKVFLITCPEGACRYREGNIRARKRLIYAQTLIEEIGLNKDRLEFIALPAGTKTTIDQLARELLARENAKLPLMMPGFKQEQHHKPL